MEGEAVIHPMRKEGARWRVEAGVWKAGMAGRAGPLAGGCSCGRTLGRVFLAAMSTLECECACSVLPREPLSYAQTNSKHLVHSPCLGSVLEEGWTRHRCGRDTDVDRCGQACAALHIVRSSGPGGAFAWQPGQRLPPVRLSSQSWWLEPPS